MLRRLVAFSAAVAAGILVVGVSGAAGTSGGHGRSDNKLGKIQHIVVIYEENHSFDNLYGGWEGVNGRANADAAHTLQKSQAGGTYACLRQTRRQPDLAAALGDVPGRGSDEPLHERAVPDRRLPAAGRPYVPEGAAGVQLPQRSLEDRREHRRELRGAARRVHS